jgi:hypothetical protein
MERDGVLWRRIGERGREAGYRTLVEVVLCLGTEEESTSTKDGVGGKGRALDRPGSAESLRG